MTGSSLPPRRRFRGLEPAERVAQRREQLLDAGLEAFGTRGFHGTGVRDICAIAKLTERYFYESFKNREALFTAVYERAVKQLEVDVGAALSQGSLQDTKQLTRDVLRVPLRAFRDDPRIARVVLIEALMGAAGERVFVSSRRFSDMVGRLLGVLYPDDAERHGVDQQLVAAGLYGATIYIMTRWTLDGFQQPLETIVEHCALFSDALQTEHALREAQR